MYDLYITILIHKMGESMGRDYVIITDSSNDLPVGYAEEQGVVIIPISFEIGDEVFDGREKTLTKKEFYDRMRAGQGTKTGTSTISKRSLRRHCPQEKTYYLPVFPQVSAVRSTTRLYARKRCRRNIRMQRSVSSIPSVRVVDTVC